MASLTQITWRRRDLNKAGQGRRRKNYLKNHGSTPKDLPLDQPNTHERTQAMNRQTTAS